jgi:CRISPR-associated protein Csm5
MVKQCLKDYKNFPYVPGSTIKGAIRSILLRNLANNDAHPPEFDNTNLRYAARPMENRYFAKNDSNTSNYNFWRGVKIGDSSLIDIKKMRIGLSQVYPMKDKDNNLTSMDIYFEIIPKYVEFTAQLTIDNWFYKQKKIGFTYEKYVKWIHSLPEIAKEDLKNRLSYEYSFLEYYKYKLKEETSITLAHFDNIKEINSSLEDNEFIISLGFGTGWLDKTLGYVLSEKLDEDFNIMTEDLHLGKGQWFYDDIFPLTRTVVTVSDQERAPFGFLKVRMEEVA